MTTRSSDYGKPEGEATVSNQVLVALGTADLPRKALQAELNLVQDQVFDSRGQLTVQLQAHRDTLRNENVDCLHMVCIVRRDADMPGRLDMQYARSVYDIAPMVKAMQCRMVFLAGEGSEIFATELHKELALLGVQTCAVVGIPDTADNLYRERFIRQFYRNLLDNSEHNPEQSVQDAYRLTEEEMFRNVDAR